MGKTYPLPLVSLFLFNDSLLPSASCHLPFFVIWRGVGSNALLMALASPVDFYQFTRLLLNPKKMSWSDMGIEFNIVRTTLPSVLCIVKQIMNLVGLIGFDS